jgi:hypothetical protein
MSKGKDPAFLWYPDEWIGGTRLMDFAHMGAYMECLMMQYKNGHLSTDQIKVILKSDFHLWETGVRDKFEVDINGLYYNDKLERVVEERRKYKDGRIENLRGHKAVHMDAPYETPICRDRNRDRDISLSSFGIRLQKAFSVCNHFPIPKDRDLVKIQDGWEKLYSNKDIEREILKADTWTATNGKRSKLTFISNWLERASSTTSKLIHPDFPIGHRFEHEDNIKIYGEINGSKIIS